VDLDCVEKGSKQLTLEMVREVIFALNFGCCRYNGYDGLRFIQRWIQV
jgi:hypothetical protein